MKTKLLFLFFTTLIFSQSYKIIKGQMTFKAIAKTVGIESDLIGTGNGLSGDLNLTEKSFNFVYDMWNIDTGIELRNDHMHDNYLETEDYPVATFKGSLIKLENDSIQASGIFSLHGAEKKITIFGLIKDNILIAHWSLNLKDYNIEIPEKFLVAKLDENLSMEIKAQLKEN